MVAQREVEFLWGYPLVRFGGEGLVGVAWLRGVVEELLVEAGNRCRVKGKVRRTAFE